MKLLKALLRKGSLGPRSRYEKSIVPLEPRSLIIAKYTANIQLHSLYSLDNTSSTDAIRLLNLTMSYFMI